MSNLTLTQGTVTIESTKKETVADVLSLFKKTKDWLYGIELKNPRNIAIEESRGGFFATGGFSGMGKNSFDTNIERMLPWLSDELQPELLKKLEGAGFRINWVFHDTDPGNNWLVSETVDLYHPSELPFKDVTPAVVDIVHTEHLDFSVKNVMNAFGFSEEEAEEYMFGESNERED